MKRFYNLPRAAGKTTRLLYLSEHYQTPILCTHDKKHILIERANQFGIDIPTPIDVNDIKNKKISFDEINEVIIDEPILVFQNLIGTKIIAMAYSDEDNSKKIRYFSSDGYTDENIL